MDQVQSSQPASTRLLAAAIGVVLTAVLALEIYGLCTARLFVDGIWEQDGWKRFLHYICVFAVISAPLMVLVPWTYTGFVLGLAAVGTILAAGPMALFAVLLYMVSAAALGSCILGRPKDTALPAQTLAVLVGTAVYMFLMTLAARLPIHYPAVWAVLLGAPIVWDWSGVRRRSAALADWLRGAELRSWGERSAASLLVFVLGMQWLVAMKPEISADGLAMHLAVPMNIAAYHRLTYEPSRYIWSVMPMGADWIYSIVYQFGGEAASRLVDFAMLLSVEILLYGAARRWLNRAPALLVCALFASTPMVQLVTGSLFVENVLAALVLGLLTAIWRLGDTGEKRYLFAAALLGGAALTTKFGAIAFVLLAIAVGLAEIRRVWPRLAPRPVLACAAALLLFAATAAPTYAIAYAKTHNPLFPFLNQRFPSPLLDHKAETQDSRYRDPVTLRMPYDLTFRTENYYEARNGSFGFQYLALLPVVLVGLLAVRNRQAAGAAVVAVAASILILRSTSNARYIYTAMPLLTIGFAAVMGWTAAHSRILSRTSQVFAVAWIGLNIYFLPASGWYHRDFYSPYMFSRNGAARYLQETAPERLVVRHYSQAHPGSSLLMAADTNIADARGDVYENSWHQWDNSIAIQRTSNASDLRRLFDKWRVRYFIAPEAATGQTLQPPWLRNFLDACTATEYELGGYALSHMAECRGDLSHTRPYSIDTRPMVPAGPGTYDDFDEDLRFDGAWEHNRTFNGPFLHTITFTDAPNAAIRFQFTGHSIAYIFTRTTNRGIVKVLLDGTDQGDLDLYAPKTQWQARSTFTAPQGQHTIEIRVAGRKSAASSGTFVDVDAFIVQ